MNTIMLRRVKRLFNCGVRSVDRHNRRAWVRSVRQLGDKWLLAQPIKELQS